MTRAGQAGQKGGAGGALLCAIGLVAALITLGWILLLAPVSARVLSQRSGFPTRTGWVAANPFTGSLRGSELTIDNPSTRGGGAFVRTGAFSAQVELGSVGEAELVLSQATLDLTALTLVIEPDGSTNGGAWLEALKQGTDAQLASLPRYARAGWPWEVGAAEGVLIRQLELTVGVIEVVDRTGPVPRTYREQLNFSDSFENVRNVTDLLTPALVQRLAAAPAVWNALLDNGLGEELAKHRNLLQRAGDLLNSVFRKLEDSGKP